MTSRDSTPPPPPPSVPHELERQLQAAAERMSRLQDFTASLSSAVTMREVGQVVTEQGLERFGARAVGIVWMLEPGSLQLVFGRGVSEAEFRALDAAARRGERMPIRDAIVGRRSVWLETPEEIRAEYPQLEPLRAARGETGCAVVPLVVGERCPGVIAFTSDRPRRLAPDERAFIETLAQLSAQAFDRARLFEAEQEARREAERIGHLQHHLMAVVCHDLRAPLQSILLTAGTLARSPSLEPRHAQAAARIASSAARANGILRDLLDYGRTRQGLGLVVERMPADLGAIAQAVVAELAGAEPSAPVTVSVHGDVALEADPGRLSQVVANLVSNALQHGQGGPVELAITGGAAEVSLVVRNGGPPIPSDLLPHVFEPFRRGPRGEAGGSVGLGLFIVREIVAGHGGSVEVRSDATAGTEFLVRLPRVVPAA